ncbi:MULTISPECIES: methyltransferase domain-containing protein [Aerosakkonema]|uniref:methyltransferase domain-containing protein n=1 Tax=Aerosakkonema TaxID=1246629 RepID=UPI0035B70B37
MYKWNAEDYHRNSSEQQRLAREFIAKIALKGNENILDIGCGDGKITAELATLVKDGSVTGIDGSEEMIDFARQKFPQSHFPNLRFEYKNATNLNLENQFDLIVSFNCLHWINDHIPVLEGIEKSLKPHGKIQLLLAGKTDDTCMRMVVDKVICQGKWKNYFQELISPFGLYKAHEYKEMLEKVGLKSNRVEAITTNMIFDGTEGFKGLLRTTWLPLTEKLPEDLRADIIDELAEAYIQFNPPNGDGFVYMPMVKLEVEATKVETSIS